MDFRLGLMHDNAEVYDYEIGIIKLALEHTSGEHQLILVPMANTVQERVFNELEKANIDVFFSGYSKAREERFLQIDFPLTRGMLGNRVFLIKPEVQSIFNKVDSFESFKALISIGSGIGWPETRTFLKAGLKVYQASYEQLWKMLSNNRFEGFHRGVHEVQVELKQRENLGLILEEKIMLVLKFDYFTYVGKHDVERHRILSEGFARIVENGAFDSYFENHPTTRGIIDKIKPAQRLKFEISNPEIEALIERIPSHYWLDLGH